jgi:hypothetical protein
MPNKKRLRLSLRRDEALRATRVSIGKQKLVYVLIADKRLQYDKGKSRIVYIGTTKTGVKRVVHSVASRAETILSLRGVRTFHARIVTCKARQNVKTWHKLERALLIDFRRQFGEVPRCNSHGKKFTEVDEFEYFTRKGARNIIEELS